MEKDYIKKQIDIFFKELANLLSKMSKKEEKIKELSSISEIYTGKQILYFINNSSEDIIEEYKNDYEKLDIIIELIFASKDIFTQKEYTKKIIDIVHYLNKHSMFFSIRRNYILKEIEKNNNF